MAIFSVSQFIEFVNTAFTAAVFPEGAIIEGEVAEYRVSQDKWIWFLLKDEQSVVSCFATVWQLRTPLEDGMKIRVMGLPKVHAKSGKFSINVEQVELVGEGALRRAFELLKKKLTAEGLFAPERKRPIPRFPERIGLITSREAAAYSDFLRILGNRWGGVEVSVVHTQVQGQGAVHDIVEAFAYFNRHPGQADVLVLTRGGGSLEDLQAFNSEDVARAVFGAKVPVIVGVGHERDETLVDFVADVRASTPTNAAELVVPDRREIAARVAADVQQIDSRVHTVISEKVFQIRRIEHIMERAAQRGILAISSLLQDFGQRMTVFIAMLEHRTRDVVAKERLLGSLDPRRVLARGYALVRCAGTLVTNAATVDIGAKLEVQFYKGTLQTEVVKKL